MTFKQIKAYIKERGQVDSHNYSFRKELLEKHTCTKRVWCGGDDWKNKYKDTMPVRDEDTITYDHCLYTEFKVKNCVLWGVMTVMRDSFCGREQVCELTFKITKATKHLIHLVDDYIEDEAERIIQREDEEILRQRLFNAKKSIIGGL